MSRIVVQSYSTLDGVVQSGGDPDEDRDGGFAHGGWMSVYNAQHDTLGEFGEIVGAWEHNAEALLLGRKTYAIFAGSWGAWDENVAGMQQWVDHNLVHQATHGYGPFQCSSRPTGS